MRQVECVARVQETRDIQVFCGKTRRNISIGKKKKTWRTCEDDIKVDKYESRMPERGLDSPVADCCEHGNELSCPHPSTKFGELLDYVCNR